MKHTRRKLRSPRQGMMKNMKRLYSMYKDLELEYELSQEQNQDQMTTLMVEMREYMTRVWEVDDLTIELDNTSARKLERARSKLAKIMLDNEVLEKTLKETEQVTSRKLQEMTLQADENAVQLEALRGDHEEHTRLLRDREELVKSLQAQLLEVSLREQSLQSEKERAQRLQYIVDTITSTLRVQNKNLDNAGNFAQHQLHEIEMLRFENADLAQQVSTLMAERNQGEEREEQEREVDEEREEEQELNEEEEQELQELLELEDGQDFELDAEALIKMQRTFQNKEQWAKSFAPVDEILAKRPWWRILC